MFGCEIMRGQGEGGWILDFLFSFSSSIASSPHTLCSSSLLLYHQSVAKRETASLIGSHHPSCCCCCYSSLTLFCSSYSFLLICLTISCLSDSLGQQLHKEMRPELKQQQFPCSLISFNLEGNFPSFTASSGGYLFVMKWILNELQCWWTWKIHLGEVLIGRQWKQED